jgi:hypothetical protein
MWRAGACVRAILTGSGRGQRLLRAARRFAGLHLLIDALALGDKGARLDRRLTRRHALFHEHDGLADLVFDVFRHDRRTKGGLATALLSRRWPGQARP